MKTFKIALARTLTSNGKDYVLYTTTCGRTIFRTLKQAINDLQGSGRALTVNVDSVDLGFARMNPLDKAIFIKAILTTRGADLIGDIRDNKAGDTYVDSISGETKVVAKDGVFVEGFLSIPFTEVELMREALATTGASQMLAMFGISAPTLNVVPEHTTPAIDTPANGVPNVTPAEAFAIPEHI